MRISCVLMSVCVAAGLLTARGSVAADQYGLEKGTPEIKSAGPMAFGPDGILFIADTKGGAVFALSTGEKAGDPSKVNVQVNGLNVRLAQLLKAESEAINVTDLAVNPRTGTVYLSVMNGSRPALVRLGADGQPERVSLDNVPFAKVNLPAPPADEETGEGRRRRNNRGDAVTDLNFFEGQLILSGLTSQGPGSAVMSIAFPFSEFSPPAALEIYHGAHGKLEDYAAPRTFVPFMIDGEPHLLAGYVCTPLVKFPLDDLKGGDKVRGTTVAELGNRNRPLDMVAYEQDGKSFLLMANSARGVMKISTDDIARSEGISEPVGGGGTAGQPYETIASLEGTVQLDRLNDTHAVVIRQYENGTLDLETVPLP